MNKLTKAVIMAGGTGGHIFPGLAIANTLQQHQVEIHWLGSHQGMETQIIPKYHIPLTTLPISGWRGKSLTHQLLLPWHLMQTIYYAYGFLKTLRPDIVIGMGGFAAGPGGIAAKLLGIPLIIHEQNRIAGLTNRYLAKLANLVLCAFPDTFSSHPKIHVVGNPVRAELFSLAPPAQRYAQSHKPLNLLILGGSRGAKAINDIVPQALNLLAPEIRPHVRHQTGNALFSETQQQYVSLGITAQVMPFIDDMLDAYTWADMIICRAGAATISEIMTAGLPAIFIPYPHATDDHQTANARYLTDQSAGILLPQSQLTATTLAQQLQLLIANETTRLQLAQNAYALRPINPLTTILTLLQNSV